MEYQVVAYCDDYGCRCEHRAGVILYAGPDREAADQAAADSPYTGYRVVVETTDAQQSACLSTS